MYLGVDGAHHFYCLAKYGLQTTFAQSAILNLNFFYIAPYLTFWNGVYNFTLNEIPVFFKTQEGSNPVFLKLFGPQLSLREG